MYCDCNPLQCIALQHTTIHCNTPTLQHTATLCNSCAHWHCNTPQHNAIRCNTLPHTAIHAHTYTATRCNTLQHTAAHCSTLMIQVMSSHADMLLHLLSFFSVCCSVTEYRLFYRSLLHKRPIILSLLKSSDLTKPANQTWQAKVPMCKCVSVCAHIHTYIYTDVHMFVYVCAHIHPLIHTHMHTHIHTRVHVFSKKRRALMC